MRAGPVKPSLVNNQAAATKPMTAPTTIKMIPDTRFMVVPSYSGFQVI
jgi:hypothetical protein